MVRQRPRRQVITIKLRYQVRKVKYSLLSNLNLHRFCLPSDNKYVTKKGKDSVNKRNISSISHFNVVTNELLNYFDVLLTQILEFELCAWQVPNNVSTSCVVVLRFHYGDRSKKKGTSICLLFVCHAFKTLMAVRISKIR